MTAAGDYPIRADIPIGSPVEASATFTVINPSIILSPDRGNPGNAVTVNGSGFARNTPGRVLFDTDGNGLYDPGEPSQSLTTSGSGAFVTTLVAPTVGEDQYDVLADFPIGSPIDASATFDLVHANIILDPEGGNPGDTVDIDGDSFAANTPGRVFFDTNGNGACDSGEPSQSLTTDSYGGFSTTLTAPSGGLTVNALADFPIGSPVEAYATFYFWN
jgi:hypothetical protein